MLKELSFLCKMAHQKA
ncbi:hypothetical protein CGLO_18010 [Colletotrichum gloeosporioides Cg-14]|uniref:Uncharacterized protein n=1 Tax=Colletotrichum gloeosporioides (strain Cg-14) TaxID=1237896 RepID=T0JS59_COLGC|nr:hypothetical protein CGLO_18010 [Colletotrichum gloeosporioides Cg-14]